MLDTLHISIHALREEGDLLSGLAHHVCGISIHALREEGDYWSISMMPSPLIFLSTPSARRATEHIAMWIEAKQFLSTPSARRATAWKARAKWQKLISIHALREEGDRAVYTKKAEPDLFLSTPSARRATVFSIVEFCPRCISIHALREEGDSPAFCGLGVADVFLSTPSARRATKFQQRRHKRRDISIHALREEGDDFYYPVFANLGISIHALREEGDQGGASTPSGAQDFYPRPPRGGRPASVGFAFTFFRFLSTPSARRATGTRRPSLKTKGDFYPRPPRGGRPLAELQNIMIRAISIHALREEGDSKTSPKHRIR